MILIRLTCLDSRLYALEKQKNNPGQEEGDFESAPLLDPFLDTDSVFRRALDGELEKVCSFYHKKETELYKEVEELTKEVESYIEETAGLNMDSIGESMVKSRRLSASQRNAQGSLFRSLGVSSRENRSSTVMDGDDAESDEDVDISELPTRDIRRHSISSRDRHRSSITTFPQNSDDYGAGEMSDSRVLSLIHDSDQGVDPRFSAMYDVGVSLKKRAIGIYVSLCELKSFIQLNRTGFSKALKKYDKILDRSLRRSYMNTTVSTAYPFTNPTIQELDDRIGRVEKLYASFVTKGDFRLARRELRLQLREHVVWERNTVWREMIGIERKAQAANMGIRRTLLGGEQDPAAAQRQGDEQEAATKEIITPVGKCPIPSWILSSTFATLVAIIAVFCILLSVPIMEQPEQQNCLAMLIFASLLWATEVWTDLNPDALLISY